MLKVEAASYRVSLNRTCIFLYADSSGIQSCEFAILAYLELHLCNVQSYSKST